MLDRYLARNTALAAGAPDGSLVIMSPLDSSFITLNEVAASIWQAADGRRRLSDIVDSEICPHFDIAPAVARQDAARFVGELSDLGMLLISDAPFDETVPAPCSDPAPHSQP